MLRPRGSSCFGRTVEIVVAELAPHAENLQALGVIAVDQEVVSHIGYSGAAPVDQARGRNLCTIRLWTTARAMGNALNEILERQRVPPLNYVSGGHADDPLGYPGEPKPRVLTRKEMEDSCHED